jgi:hypothetical protein
MRFGVVMCRVVGVLVALASGWAGSARAQLASPPEVPTRKVQIPIRVDQAAYSHIATNGTIFDEPHPGGTQRACQTVSTHTDANFGGGSFVVQAGFGEKEIAAAEYVRPAADFPLKIDLLEFIIAQSNATVVTETQWSVLVWEGNPRDGNLVFVFSSDDVILPHILMPPGTQATNLQLAIDPSDPEQIIIGPNATNSFSIGFRIDKHNNQTQSPCLVAPPSSQNAFPTTDTTGLSQTNFNWLFGLNCGSFGCPPNGGWVRFGSLASFCRPTGDWVMRATWTSLSCTPGVGACCLPNGSCIIATTNDCAAAGGAFQGDGSTCATAACQAQPQACCFPTSGGCLNLNPNDCITAGGVPGGLGTTCQSFTCFPKGACCLPNGTCLDDLSPDDCESLQGTYRGNNSLCSVVNCPPPTGACCFPNGACLTLVETDCTTAGGSWSGIGTTCADFNGNGQADICELDCPSDVNNDGVSDVLDLLDFLDSFSVCSGSAGPCVGPSGVDADYNEDLLVDVLDLLDFLNDFSVGCD